jgi:hypothetical protein
MHGIKVEVDGMKTQLQEILGHMKSKGKEQTGATHLHFTPKPKGENPGSCVLFAPGTIHVPST